MNIFDTSELDKKIAEAEAAMFAGDEIKQEKELPKEDAEELEEEEVLEDGDDEAEDVDSSGEPAIDDDEDAEPTDPKGWKKLRQKKIAAKAEAEEARLIAEKSSRENAELRERLARLEGREEGRAKPEISKEPEDQEPDRDIDPDAHVTWRMNNMEKELQAAKKTAAEAQAASQIEGIRRGLDMLEKEYIKSNKVDDYNERIEHIRKIERNLIKVRHPSATEEQITRHLDSQRLELGADAYKNGNNPAKMFIEMSEALGYAKPSSKKTVSDKPDIEAINRNQKKSASLIGSSNAEKPGGIPPERLVKMSMAELMTPKSDKAMNDAIKREEAKMWG